MRVLNCHAGLAYTAEPAQYGQPWFRPGSQPGIQLSKELLATD
jgi:hypothetical protein